MKTRRCTKRYQYNTQQLIGLTESIKFLGRCRKSGIIPNFIKNATKNIVYTLECNINNEKISSKINKAASSYLVTVQKKLLNIIIKIKHELRKKKEKEVNKLTTNLKQQLNEEDSVVFFESETLLNNKLTTKIKKTQTDKFYRLKDEQKQLLNIKHIPQWFCNTTSTNIPADTQWLLSLGPKYALPTKTKNFPLFKIIADGEDCIQTIVDRERQETERNNLTTLIRDHLKRPNYNTRDNFVLDTLHSAKEFLSNNKHLLVLSADKGNVTVVLEKSEYETKLGKIVNDITSYRVLKRDPTNKLQEKNNEFVEKMFKNKMISLSEKYRLLSKTANAPRLYGLPKIHKEGIPLRPICSSVNSPSYTAFSFVHVLFYYYAMFCYAWLYHVFFSFTLFYEIYVMSCYVVVFHGMLFYHILCSVMMCNVMQQKQFNINSIKKSSNRSARRLRNAPAAISNSLARINLLKSRMRSSNNNSERKQEYLAHRMRIQNAKSVVNSQPPCHIVKRPPREMSFTEMMNSVRTAIQKRSNTRTFTTAPPSATTSATATLMTVATVNSSASPRNLVHKSRMKISKSERITECVHDKSAMLLYDCNSCGAFGCCCTCGGAGDGRHCLSTCADLHEKYKQHIGQERGAGDACRNVLPIQERSSFSSHTGYYASRSNQNAVEQQSMRQQQRTTQHTNKTAHTHSPKLNPEERAAYQHARLAMPLRSFWHRVTRKEWNDDTRVPQQKPCRPLETKLTQRKRAVHKVPSNDSTYGIGCNSSHCDDAKHSSIPLNVLRRYQDLTVSSDESMLRRLLRPRIFFDLEVKGIRPLGRIIIQLYTEACPEVVLEFVRMCTAANGERVTFTRLLPPLWLEGELALVDNKTLTAHSIEHDTNVLDHGCGAGVLSFPSRYVRGSKRRFLSFSISFKPLKVLNGKRIAFGRIKRGLWILDAVQDYGTNSGKPQRDIVVTSCGLCN
ncbi:uncharacterized protein [Eurosta solidaginis]|uniref:uncharacterized protein n=1 Tax=Eurosta solidaginis TaxID=178769 RepID=UPI0035310637